MLEQVFVADCLEGNDFPTDVLQGFEYHSFTPVILILGKIFLSAFDFYIAKKAH
jgi:hypothetical protein